MGRHPDDEFGERDAELDDVDGDRFRIREIRVRHAFPHVRALWCRRLRSARQTMHARSALEERDREPHRAGVRRQVGWVLIEKTRREEAGMSAGDAIEAAKGELNRYEAWVNDDRSVLH